jgi:hypothetical protein
MKQCIQNQKHEIQSLQDKIKQLQAGSSIINNNTTNNIVIINTFGYENTNYISNSFLKECLKERDLPKLFEEVHFNPNHPENHNIRIRNIHKQMLEYFEEGRWIIEPKEKILKDAINICGYKLNDCYKHFKDEIEQEIAEEQHHYGYYYVNQQVRILLDELYNENETLFKRLKKEFLASIIKYK